MLIFSGAGILVPVFSVLGFWFLRDFLDYTLIHHPGYYAAHGWAHFLSALIVAAACYALGTFLSRPTNEVIVDKTTREERPVRHDHTFFFIPRQWWAFIIVAVGIYLWIRGCSALGQLRYAEGVEAVSPGLRGTSYPGSPRQGGQLRRSCIQGGRDRSQPPSSDDQTIQPFQGRCLVGQSQGSSCLATLG